jgi:hypothetical protein
MRFVIQAKALMVAALTATAAPVGAASLPGAASVLAPAPYGALPSPRQLKWHELEVYGMVNFSTITYYNRPEIMLSIVHKLQPEACIFTEIGPEIRWIGNEGDQALDPCWATFTPRYRGTTREVEINPQTGYYYELPNGDSNYPEAEHGHRNGRLWIPAEADFPLRGGWFWHAGDQCLCQWREFATGTGIGARRLWRGQSITSAKLRLRLINASASPAISEFGVYLAQLP